jgi:hypothetical protein
MKYFKEEIEKFYTKLVSGEKFAFSKYADGEWAAINGRQGNAGCGEWIINDINNNCALSREKLVKSFRYKDENYFVGISCPCCQGKDHYKMKKFCSQNEENLTFANIFVNANYQFYLDNFINEYKNRNIYLVANKKTNPAELPFNIDKFFGIDYNAWVVNLDLVDQLKDDKCRGKLFLFSAGPLGNILCHELWQINKDNTYIDIGSTIDPWTKTNKLKNKYYNRNSLYKNKICVWG